MNIKKQLQKAILLFEKDKIEEADQLSAKLLKAKPNNHQVLALRGAILVKSHQFKSAKAILEKALTKDKNNPDIINNLATTYINLDSNAKAVALLQQNIKKDDTVASFFSNLGVAYFNLRKYFEAKESYEHALKINKNFLEAKFNHAVCLRKIGLLHESVDEFLEINDSQPLLSSVYFHLSELLLLLHATDDAEKVIDAGLSISSSSPVEQFHALTSKSLIAWITGKIETSRESLRKSQEIDIPMSARTKGYAEANAFNICLSRLLDLREELVDLYTGNPEKPIFFVSESHCLSPSELIVFHNNTECRFLSLMVRGCKAYHLANEENNEYKSSFVSALAALPHGSLVILAFGEIDCRIDQGIFTAYKSKGIDYKESLPRYLHDYVTYCLSIAEKHNHRVIFSGVPPLSKNFGTHIDHTDQALLHSIILTFNNVLKQCCLDHSVSFLDVFNAACDEHGFRKSEYDLDGIHLHPQVFPVAFRSFLS